MAGVTWEQMREMRKKHTMRGVTDWKAMSNEIEQLKGPTGHMVPVPGKPEKTKPAGNPGKNAEAVSMPDNVRKMDLPEVQRRLATLEGTLPKLEATPGWKEKNAAQHVELLAGYWFLMERFYQITGASWQGLP